MRLLVFEFATASGLDDPSIFAEGYAMLSGLLDDLEGMDADYLISNDLEIISSGFCNPIFIKEDLAGWINENILKYDACLAIAPEEDLILYKITKLIERKGVDVIGPNSDAVLTCSDKYRTYEALKGKLPVVETECIFFENPDRYKTHFEDYTEKIVKPADGVSCSGIEVVRSFKEFKEASFRMKTNFPYFLLQDFIDGIPSSVSLLCNGKKALPLSLNFQNIQFKNKKISYNGGYVPLEHELSDEAKKIAKKAVESIDGLRGYVGVDLILGENVHVVEVNPRITTPYAALKDILNFNLGKAIIDSVYGRLPDEVALDGRMVFEKRGNFLEKRKIS